jgi:hypothetical protein
MRAIFIMFLLVAAWSMAAAQPDTIHSTGKSSGLRFGGEWREQLQYYGNINFGDLPPTFPSTTTWQLWHRMMVHANWQLNSRLRVFAELNSTYRFFSANPFTPEIDEDRLSLHQAYAEYQYSPKGLLRIGRQELSYGNHRLLTYREGPNTRLSFDGLVLKQQIGKHHVDLLAISPGYAKLGVFDNEHGRDWILGAYAGRNLLPGRLQAEYYFLHFSSSRRLYNFVGGKESRQTIGGRIYSTQPVINYELEANYQFGHWNELQISAYSVAIDLHHRVLQPLKGRLGLTAQINSGDRSGKDHRLNTYNLLYSKPQYGLAAPIGATNIISVTPYLRFKPNPKSSLYAAVNLMWRQSSQDGVYSPGGLELRPGPAFRHSTPERQLGKLLVLESSYALTKQLSFAFDASYFLSGNYVQATGKGRNITYLAFKTSLKL